MTVSKATGFSPYEVMFGEAPLPLQGSQMLPLPPVPASLGVAEAADRISDHVHHL